MKRLLLLVLACGMFVSAFAQPEDSDKWVITPVTTMKGVLGRLDINFPADVERNILIHRQSDNEFLKSVSYNDKTFTIAPGEYRFVLSTVPIENVPIKKGHETRLKAGFLNIVSEGDWHLYDETKEKAYTSGNNPKKLPLPVGSYQINLGGQFYPVIIKDGETVEDYTLGTAEFYVFEPWEIKPLGAPIDGNKGKLDTYFPVDTSRYLKVYRYVATPPYGSISMPVIELKGGTIKSIILGTGTYKVLFNGFTFHNLPIYDDSSTRIRSGYLHINAEYSWDLYDTSGHLLFYNSSHKYHRNKFALPTGSYRLSTSSQSHLLTIKDEEIIKIGNPTDEETTSRDSLSDSWIIRMADLEGIMGRLLVDFDPQVNWTLDILTDKNIFVKTLSRTNNQGYYNLQPGAYTIKLHGVTVENVPIMSGRITRLRTGLLKIRNPYQWELRNEKKNILFTSGNKPANIVLPVGSYQLKLGSEFYTLIISEGIVEEF